MLEFPSILFPESPRLIELAPSILSADFARLGEQVSRAAEGGGTIIHVDVMDGHFVPNITLGPQLVKSLRKATKLPLDCHLMIENPDEYIPAFAEAGADWISVHQEACRHLDRTLNLIKTHNCHAGVVINPATPVGVLSEVLDISGLCAGDVGESGIWGAAVHPQLPAQDQPVAGFTGTEEPALPHRSRWRDRRQARLARWSAPEQKFWWRATRCSSRAIQ